MFSIQLLLNMVEILQEVVQLNIGEACERTKDGSRTVKFRTFSGQEKSLA